MARGTAGAARTLREAIPATRRLEPATDRFGLICTIWLTQDYFSFNAEPTFFKDLFIYLGLTGFSSHGSQAPGHRFSSYSSGASRPGDQTYVSCIGRQIL